MSLNPIEKIRLSRESIALVAQLPSLKAVEKIKAARRLNEITLLLGGDGATQTLTAEGAETFHENLKADLDQDEWPGVDLSPFERIVRDNEITIETLTGAIDSTKMLLNSVSVPPIFIEAIKAVSEQLESGALYDAIQVDQLEALAGEMQIVLDHVEQSQVHDAIAQSAATSELNTGVNPTQEQLEANQYQTAHIEIAGLKIAIENPIGSVRRGVDKDGQEWETTMTAHYGYFEGTLGADGDELDVFVVENLPQDFSGRVFVIDQIDRQGRFDEHKVMLGVTSKATALALYQAHYDENYNSVSRIREYSLEEFKERIAQPTAFFDSLHAMLLDSWADDGRYDLLPVSKLDRSTLNYKMNEAKPSIKEPIVALQSGSKYLVIHGQKRLELAKKNAEKFVPAIVFDHRSNYSKKDIERAIKQCGSIVHAEALAALIEVNATQRLTEELEPEVTA